MRTKFRLYIGLVQHHFATRRWFKLLGYKIYDFYDRGEYFVVKRYVDWVDSVSLMTKAMRIGATWGLFFYTCVILTFVAMPMNIFDPANFISEVLEWISGKYYISHFVIFNRAVSTWEWAPQWRCSWRTEPFMRTSAMASGKCISASSTLSY